MFRKRVKQLSFVSPLGPGINVKVFSAEKTLIFKLRKFIRKMFK